MRLTQVAAFAALFGTVLSAQTPARQVSNNGALEADLHYAAGSDTWVSTNKPAYVALFDLSRQRIAQIYPTFSAQAAYPIGNEHRLVAIGQGGGGIFGGSFSNATWGGGIGAWPHTYLLIASTSPLRVSSPWSTDLELNHQMLLRHIIDWQSDDGIQAIIDMVHPADPSAEMAYDRTDGIQPAARYLAQEGFGAFRPLGPSVVNCLNSNYSQLPLVGGALLLQPICAIPYPAPPTTPIVPPKKDTATSTTPVTPANVNRNVASDHRVITDPDEIRRFIESQTGHRSDASAANRSGGTPVEKQGAQNSTAADKSTANVSRQKSDGAPAQSNTPRPTNTDHPSIHQQDHDRPAPAPARDASPRVSSPAPAAAPSQAPPIIKP